MSFPAVVDDDGTGTTGTVLDKAFFDAYNAEIASGIGGSSVTSAAPSGSNLDLALPAAAQIRILSLTPASNISIRAFTGTAKIGDVIIVRNAGTAVISFIHNTAPAQALINFATSAPTPIAAGGSAAFFYNAAAQWAMCAHEQGAWITATYSAANFTGSASMTWTVDAGDVITCAYYLKGRALTFSFYLTGTSVGGTVSTQLRIAAPAFGGFAPTKQMIALALGMDAGAALGLCYADVQVAGGVYMFKAPSGNWALSTNNTNMQGQVTFEVN